MLKRFKVTDEVRKLISDRCGGKLFSVFTQYFLNIFTEYFKRGKIINLKKMRGKSTKQANKRFTSIIRLINSCLILAKRLRSEY